VQAATATPAITLGMLVETDLGTWMALSIYCRFLLAEGKLLQHEAAGNEVTRVPCGWLAVAGLVAQVLSWQCGAECSGH